MKMTTFTVHGEPQGKARPRAVRQSGVMHIYTPKKTKDYEREIAMAYMTQCSGMFSGAVEMEIHAYYTIPKSASRKRVLDMVSDIERPTKKPTSRLIRVLVVPPTAANACFPTKCPTTTASAVL